MLRKVATAVALAAPALVSAKIDIDPMKDDFAEAQAAKIDGILAGNREFGVAAIWYYTDTRADASFKSEFNEIAKKTKNMIKVMAVDCDKPGNKKHCGGLNWETTPHVMVYPPLPMPAFHYKGELKEEKLLKTLYKQIPGHKVTALTTMEEYTSFTKKSPTKPKVILFSEAKKAPTILKGLSTELVFVRSIEFGFVSKGAAEAVVDGSGAGKKKLPAVLMVNKGKKEWFKPDKSKNEEMNFQTLYNWINLSSESGMGDNVKSTTGGASAAEQAEMEMEEPETETLRELKDKSQRELCFGQKNMCGILLTEGKATEKDQDTVNAFESRFAPKSDRGVKFNWMWMDVSVEAEFKKAIEDKEPDLAEREGRDAEKIKYPTMIFVKPPKKKREEKLLSYLKLANDLAIDEDPVADMVDKIAGGATYARVDLPKFVNRKAAAKAAAKAGKAEL